MFTDVQKGCEYICVTINWLFSLYPYLLYTLVVTAVTQFPHK